MTDQTPPTEDTLWAHDPDLMDGVAAFMDVLEKLDVAVVLVLRPVEDQNASGATISNVHVDCVGAVPEMLRKAYEMAVQTPPEDMYLPVQEDDRG